MGKGVTELVEDFKILHPRAYTRIYNKAIDDLVKLVCEHYTLQEKAGYCADTNNMIKQRIVDFSEQLKR